LAADPELRGVHAGIVPEGVTSGERMHKARHTAGQRVLDATGNLKAVQKLLGHELIQTTGDIYTDWDVSSSRTACSRRCKMSDLQSFPTGHGEPAWLSGKWRRRESNPRNVSTAAAAFGCDGSEQR
jgi:integrase